MSNKEIVIDLSGRSPEQASLHEIAREIEFVAAVRQGFGELDRGEGIPIEQIEMVCPHGLSNSPFAFQLDCMQHAPTTNKLIAKRCLPQPLGSEASEWAINQLVQGCDTPHLRQLSGTTGSENSFELDELFDRALHELGLSMPSREQAIFIYAKELARECLDGVVEREHLLKELCQLYISSDLKQLYPFYILRWTNDDLKEQVFSPYRRDATPGNFNELLRAEIETFLAA